MNSGQKGVLTVLQIQIIIGMLHLVHISNPWECVGEWEEAREHVVAMLLLVRAPYLVPVMVTYRIDMHHCSR